MLILIYHFFYPTGVVDYTTTSSSLISTLELLFFWLLLVASTSLPPLIMTDFEIIDLLSSPFKGGKYFGSFLLIILRMLYPYRLCSINMSLSSFTRRVGFLFKWVNILLQFKYLLSDLHVFSLDSLKFNLPLHDMQTQPFIFFHLFQILFWDSRLSRLLQNETYPLTSLNFNKFPE